MIKKRVKLFLFVLIVCSIYLIGCVTQVSSILPEEIVRNAIQVDKNITNYYGEIEVSTYTNEELIETMTMKEWTIYKEGRMQGRVEISKDDKEDDIIALIDEECVTYYIPHENEVIKITLDDELSEFVEQSYKEQIKQELESIEKTHRLENLGEEKINGVYTYRLKGEPKKEATIYGEVEFWIDKQTWFLVKQVVNLGQNRVEYEYKKADFSPKIDEHILTIDIPEDVEIFYLDQETRKPKAATINQAREQFEKPFLYFKDTDEYNIKEIQTLIFKNSVIEDEIIQEYTKDEEEVFNLIVTKLKENNRYLGGDMLPGGKEVTVRGSEGVYIDDYVRAIVFDEKDLRYSMIIHDKNMTLEKGVEILEKLSYYK